VHAALARRAEDQIHALVEANGLPIVIKLSEGQAHEGRRAADTLSGLSLGQVLIADRAYDSDLLRLDVLAHAPGAVMVWRPATKSTPPNYLGLAVLR
jgi:transposase